MPFRRMVAGIADVADVAGGGNAVRWATAVLGERCEVLLVHVLSPERAHEPGARERARAALEALGRSLAVREVAVEVTEGRVATELSAAVGRFGATLVVTGRPAERGVVESLRDDPVAELFHHSPVPVLVVRGATAVPLRRVTAAVDESELREEVFVCTRSLRQMTGADVAVAYVLDGVPYARVRQAGWSALRGEDAMEEFTREVRNGLRVNGIPWTGEETYVREGARADRIVEAAERTGAELLVMASRGPGRLRRLVSRSSAVEAAHRARCPVLVASEHQWPQVRQFRAPARITAHGIPRLLRGARLLPRRRRPAPERATE